MEHTNPSVAKKLGRMIRVIIFMLKKGMSKEKLTLGINSLMKHGNIAGKAIQNLISFRSQHSISLSQPSEYEFSCSNTPTTFPFRVNKKRYSQFFACTQAPATEDEDLVTANAVKMALEMLNGIRATPLGAGQSPTVLESPWLTGFERTPAVRQLRVTDSPYPIPETEVDSRIDEAANEFINKFYRNLKKQDGLALEC